MKNSKRVIGGLLAGLSVLAALWLWRGSPDERVGQESEVDMDTAAAEAPPQGADVSASAGGEDLPALPPADTPIDQAAPLLAAHARAGHAGAACRLAFELLSCRFSLGQDSLRGLQALSAEQQASDGNLEAAIRIEEQSLAVAESASACRRVDPSLHGDAVALLSQAARARIPYAMYLYATGEHYRYRETGFAATPEFDQWRRSAPSLMLAARDAGIPEAAAFLALAYSHDIGLAHALFPDDRVQANAHWQLQSMLGSGTTSGTFPFTLDRLDAAQERESLERARRMHEDAFDSGMFPNLSHSGMPYARISHGSRVSSDCQGPAPRVSIAAPQQAGD